jgi:hypothetical protein
VTIGPELSGRSAEEPFVMSAFPGEKPVLSGGRRIIGWKPSAENPLIWEVALPEVREGRWYFRSLFMNGKRATRARTPNSGTLFSMQGGRFSDKPVRFKFKSGDLKPAWAQDPGAELIAYEKWTDFRQHIRSINLVSNTVELSGQAVTHTRESGARYFVENTPDSLDVPGEWYLDRRTGIVRYWPLPNEDMTRVEAIAPRLEDLIRFTGNLETGKLVRYVILRGLTFSHTDWSMPENGYDETQAAVPVRGDLLAQGAVDCGIEDCTFSHLGGYGVDLGRGCQRVWVRGCEMMDLGAGGVRLGEPDARTPTALEGTHSNLITDNHLHSLGHVYAPAVGILITQSGTNRIAHNDIHDLFYSAISVGWTWGYRESPCRENVIEWNHLHTLGQGLLTDMGGVYTLGIQHGTVVRNNLIHDVDAFTYGAWGLYPDEGSTGIVWENNIVYRCKSASFHQHYGRENIVRNNIFALSREHQLMRTREEDHISFIFSNNIVYFNMGDLLGSNWKNNRYVMDRNLYFDARHSSDPGAMRFGADTLEQWRARGHDQHSILADPKFVAPNENNFQLEPASPAWKLGFKAIDLRTAGVRPPNQRGNP